MTDVDLVDLVLQIQHNLENAYLQTVASIDAASNIETLKKARESVSFLTGELEMLDIVVKWLGGENTKMWYQEWNESADNLKLKLSHGVLSIRDADEE